MEYCTYGNPEALEAVNNAAVSGVVCQIITHLDKRTIRFFNGTNIEVRHSDELESLGSPRTASKLFNT